MVGRNLHCFYYKYTFFFLKKQVKTKKQCQNQQNALFFFNKKYKNNKNTINLPMKTVDFSFFIMTSKYIYKYTEMISKKQLFFLNNYP